MKKTAIFGLGRSGLAVAKAALKEGMRPEVFDEAPLDSIAKAELVQACADIHVPVHLDAPSPLPLTLYNSDGSDGSDKAEGFDLLVVNPSIDKRHSSLKAAQGQGVEVISEIEFAYRISKAPIIAITGTNGKSTTTIMTWLILKGAGIDAILCGNIYGTGYPEIPMSQAASESTPEQVLVAEISSFQLEWVKEFHPVCACITNITPDHLNRYESFEEYAETKQRVFAKMGQENTAIIKAGDPVVGVPVGPIIKTFGSSGEHAFASESILVIGDEEIDTATLPFGGAHNYLNAMAAGLLAQSFIAGSVRTDTDEHESFVRDGLRRFKGLEHRMEELGITSDGVTIVNNSMCTNPDAVLKSCLSVSRPMHILMGGENKGLDFTPLRDLLSPPNKAYIFGESAHQISAQANGDSSVYETMQDAFEHALRNAKRGDVIILAPGCASTDQFKDFRHRGDVFRTLAKEWLQSCSGP